MAIIMTNNTLSGMGRQGGFASPKCAHFPVKIADCDLKYCILKENAKNSISGRTLRGDALKCPPKRRLIIPISDGTYQNY
jgi:hypothetical protein